MISHQKKFISIHQPHTGGIHLAKFLAPYCEEQFSPYDPNSSDLHAPLRKYVEYYGEEVLEYKIFTIIRNPWDRILSQYLFLNKASGVDGFEKKDFKEMLYKPRLHGMVPHSILSAFLKWQIPSPKGAGDWYAHSFYRNWIPLRFENYAEEVTHLLQRLDIKYNIDEVRKKTNATSHDHYSHYYDRDDVEKVMISCGADIAFFGYEFEDRGRLFDAANPPRAM